MVVQVYVWDPIKSFGHFAVKLSDDTYLSFWPINNYNTKNATNLRSVASRWNDNSAQDRFIEGRVQDDIIKIQTPLNEQLMRQFWEENKVKNFGVFNNCAVMTLKLIKAGQIDDLDQDFMRVKSRVCDSLMTILDGIANQDQNKINLLKAFDKLQNNFIYTSIIIGFITFILYFIYYKLVYN